MCVYNTHIIHSLILLAMTIIEKLESKRISILNQIAKIREFRPGSLSPNSRKCGRPACRCATERDYRHRGWQLSRKVNKKSVNRGIPVHAVDTTREQVAEYQHFVELIRDFTEVNESLCDQRLKLNRVKKNSAQKQPETNLRCRD